jgi:hypothetical protein
MKVLGMSLDFSSLNPLAASIDPNASDQVRDGHAYKPGHRVRIVTRRLVRLVSTFLANAFCPASSRSVSSLRPRVSNNGVVFHVFTKYTKNRYGKITGNRWVYVMLDVPLENHLRWMSDSEFCRPLLCIKINVTLEPFKLEVRRNASFRNTPFRKHSFHCAADVASPKTERLATRRPVLLLVMPKLFQQARHVLEATVLQMRGVPSPPQPRAPYASNQFGFHCRLP